MRQEPKCKYGADKVAAMRNYFYLPAARQDLTSVRLDYDDSKG